MDVMWLLFSTHYLDLTFFQTLDTYNGLIKLVIHDVSIYTHFYYYDKII